MNTENNKIIAEFMGYEILDKYCNPYPENVDVENLPMLEFMFNCWDELIPVIEKCRESQIFGSQRLIDNIDKRLLKLDLIATYRNTIDFINWYNLQKS